TPGETPQPTTQPTSVVGETPSPGPIDTPTPSFDAEAYFRGKTITILVGFNAGGGYDTFARLFAQIAPRHFPGQPQFVVQNLPGSGGELIFRNIEQRPADGLTTGTVHPRFIKRELLGTTCQPSTWRPTASSAAPALRRRP